MRTGWLIAFLLSLAPVLAQDSPDRLDVPKFTIKAYSSVLEVRVLEQGGSPVRNLSKDDFLLLLEGKPISITYFQERNEAPISVGILVDIGSEMKYEQIQLAKQAVFELIHLLDPKDEVLLGVYAGDVTFLSELTDDRLQLVRAIENISPGGRPGIWTRIATAFASSGNTGYAVDQALLRLKKVRNELKIVLVFSASFGNMGAATTEHLALADARLFALTWKNRVGDAFNLWSDRFARGDVVSASGGASLSAKRIQTGLESLRATLKSFYLLAYDPGSNEPEKEADLSVRIRECSGCSTHIVFRSNAENPFY